MLGRHVAALQDLKRGEKFLAEIIAAAADTGKRRGRADHRAGAAQRAVIGFDTPDRGNDGGIDAVSALHGGKDRRILGEQRAAAGDAVVAHQKVEIVPRRLGEFRLRVEQIHDVQVGRQARGEAIVILARNAAPRRIGPHIGDAIVEIGRRRADRVRRHLRIAGRAGLAAPGRIVGGTGNRTCRRGLKQVAQPIVRLVLRQSRRQRPVARNSNARRHDKRRG